MARIHAVLMQSFAYSVYSAFSTCVQDPRFSGYALHVPIKELQYANIRPAKRFGLVDSGAPFATLPHVSKGLPCAVPIGFFMICVLHYRGISKSGSRLPKLNGEQSAPYETTGPNAAEA